MIKVAFVIDAIYTPTGGTERQLLLLIKNLDKKKFAPTLCVLRTSEWIENEFDVCPLYTIGIESLKRPLSVFNLWKFARFLADERFDIVQTYFSDANILGIVASKLAGVERIISTRRNQWYCSKFSQKLVYKLLNPLVDRFVANSFSTRDLVIRIEGVNESRISVVYNALELESFNLVSSSTRNNYRRNLGIKENNVVVGIVANLREIKGLDVFLMAAQKVRSRHPDAVFLIIGSCSNDGIEERKLRLLSDYLGLGDSVHFLGERKDVPELLAAFDIAVLTSKSEGFSNSLVEYIASGLPVVTTDVGGAREAVTNGVNGFIVPVNDHDAVSKTIIDIVNGCLNEQDLLSKQHEAHEIFSLAQSIHAYEKIYYELMNS